MALVKITREEFDRRLDAANERRRQRLQEMEEQQAGVEQLLAYYERTLDEIEGELDAEKDLAVYPQRIRVRLNELAERTAAMAATL